jgi:hypothetical protein
VSAGARRRPPEPRGDAAAATLALRLVTAPVAPRLGALVEPMLIGLARRPPAPFRVEVLERAGGRVLRVQPVDGTASEARGVLLAMESDLTRLGPRDFLRRWGRRP